MSAVPGPWTTKAHLIWCMTGQHVLGPGTKWRYDEYGRVCCTLHYPAPPPAPIDWDGMTNRGGK